MMKCPSCGFEQPDDHLECECCGLIFAKWKAPTVAPASGGTAAPAAEKTEVLPPPGAVIPSLEPEIPDQPLSGPEERGQSLRLYQRLGSLYFQKNNGGDWVYFPWGGLGGGYLLKDGRLKTEMEKFESLFSCVHCSAASTLVFLSAFLWLHGSDFQYAGAVVFTVYLAVAYLFFWIYIRRWTVHLPPYSRGFNQRQYFSLLTRIFDRRTLLEPETLSLLSVLIGISLLFWQDLKLFLPGIPLIGKTWLFVSVVFWAASFYFFYVRRKN